MGVPLGFAQGQRSHLTGLGDYAAPWLKEARIALGKGFRKRRFICARPILPDRIRVTAAQAQRPPHCRSRQALKALVELTGPVVTGA